MARKTKSQLPELSQNFFGSGFISILFVLGVFLALPISQLIDSLRDDSGTQVETTELKPPDLIEEPPPPVEEEEQEDLDELKEDRKPPTLEQLELSMNTDLSAIGNSDFTIPTINVGDQLQEMIYDLKDLTRAPRPVAQQAPTYPPELKRAAISGIVELKFTVTDQGTTKNITVEKSSNPAFEEPAIRAVRKWRFDPGEKDGKPVNVWVTIEIPFNVK